MPAIIPEKSVDSTLCIPGRLSENADFLQNKAKFDKKVQFTGLNEIFDRHECRKPSPLQEQMAGESGFNSMSDGKMCSQAAS